MNIDTPRHVNRKDILILGGLLICLLICFSGVLLEPGEVCLGRPDGDARSQFYGWRAYGFSEIRAGRFPLWNPHEFMGIPFVATLQSALFYPTTWLCAVLPIGLGVNLGIVINLFLSGLFTYLWCRRLGVSRAGGLIAAVTYAFGAPQFLRIYEGHWSFLCAMPWIPCLLLCIESVVTRKRPWFAMAGGGIAIALQLFAGNPQYAFYSGIAAVLYLVVRLWQERASGVKNIARVVGCFAGMYALGVVLAGVQLVPALEMLAVSSRQGQLTYDWISQYSFVPENLLTLFSPDIFGSDIGLEYWGRWNLWEMSAYVGVVAFGLVIIAVIKGKKRLVLPVCGIALILLLFALGRHTPLLRIVYHIVPGFDLFRVPARFLCPFSLLLAALAGIGSDKFLSFGRDELTPDAPDPRLRVGMWVLAVIAVLFAVAGIFLLYDGHAPQSLWGRFMDGMLRVAPRERLYLSRDIVTPEFIVTARIHAGLSLMRSGVLLGALALLIGFMRRFPLKRTAIATILIVLVAVDMWSFSRRYLKTFDPRDTGMTPGAVAYLESVGQPFRYASGGDYTFPPCDGMTHGFNNLEGVQPNVPARFRDVFWSLQGDPKDTQKTLYRIRSLRAAFRMLNLRYIVQYKENPQTTMPGLETVYEDDRVRIDELPNAWPRAWLVHSYAVTSNKDELLELLPRFDYERQALFEEDPSVPVSIPMTPEPFPRFKVYEPNRIVIDVEAAANALLVLSDLDYPGWRVTVDGRPSPIYRANYLMRAVHVTPGKHVVEFAYQPSSFQTGLASSLIGCVVVAWLVVLGFRKENSVSKEVVNQVGNESDDQTVE